MSNIYVLCQIFAVLKDISILDVCLDKTSHLIVNIFHNLYNKQSVN